MKAIERSVFKIVLESYNHSIKEMNQLIDESNLKIHQLKENSKKEKRLQDTAKIEELEREKIELRNARNQQLIAIRKAAKREGKPEQTHMARYTAKKPEDWPDTEEKAFKLLNEKKKANFIRASDELVRLYNSPLKLAGILKSVFEYLNYRDLMKVRYVRFKAWEK